jgi:multidrug efflux pump subunit AcrA (membrane-fusion protein)
MGKLMAQAQADMESMRELNQGLQSELDDKRREIQMLKENMNTSLSEAVGRDAQLQKDLQGFERELDFLRMDANHAVSALQAQLVDTERKLQIAEEKLIESDTTIQALRDDMAIAEFERGEDEKIEMEAEILYLRKTLGEVDKEISALKNFKLTEKSDLDSLQRENQELKNQLEGSPTGTELKGLIKDANWPIPEDSSSLSLASFVRGNVLAMIKHFDQLFRDMDLDIEYLRSQLEQALMQKEDSVAHLCLKVESVSSLLCIQISKRKSLQGWTAELCKKTTLLWDKVHSETLRLPAAVSHN